MSVFAATKHHHIGEVQPDTPHPDEWRKTRGPINSVDWETVKTTSDHDCYDALDDEVIIKSYLDPPCNALPGQHLLRQKKTGLQRIRNMLKPVASAAAVGSASKYPFPPPPQYVRLRLKSNVAVAAETEAETEAEAAHRRGTLINTVEDMMIGMSSLCSQSSTISSTASDPSVSTTTTFTTTDDLRLRSFPSPMHLSDTPSRLKLAFSKLRGDHHHDQPKQAVPGQVKLKFRDSLSTVPKSKSLADRIRSKLQRHKSAAAASTTTTTHNKNMIRSHSMSSTMQHPQRKNYHHWNTVTTTKAIHPDATLAPGPKGILRVRTSSSKSFRRSPHYFDRHHTSRPLSSCTPSSQMMMMTPQSRQPVPLIHASETNTVRFSSAVSVRETFSKYEYDRSSDFRAVCTRLTPAVAQYIKLELNMYKLHEMPVHQHSRTNTHFFL